MSERARIREMRSPIPSVLLAVALVILTALLTYQLWLSYYDQVRAAEVSTRNLASIFETRLDMILHRTDADLVALAKDIPVAALEQKSVPIYAREINAKLDSRLFSVEEMAGYRVHDANGETLYSSDSAHTQRVNISDRTYFIETLATGQGVMSQPIRNRVRGMPQVVMTEPVHDAQGQWVIREKISRQDLAKMIKASREMVSRVMKDLEGSGYIRVETGRIVLTED